MVRIGTHDGTFHADEALGCWLLRRTQARGCGAARRALRARSDVQPPRRSQAFKDAEVVRTRDPARLAELDVIIDVGAVYDPGAPCLGRRAYANSAADLIAPNTAAAHRYDHHQRGFEHVFGHGTRACDASRVGFSAAPATHANA